MAKQEMRNGKKIVWGQIIISCLLGKGLELESVNVMLGSAILTSFSYQFSLVCMYLKVEP